MAVYDWGQGDVPYLVTEYLGGGSLRACSTSAASCRSSQALLVGLEAARGLEYAHRRGFVHRDIKPANLLFDEDARLRIADFGLARALAEAAWTEPMGAVLGTARYASPEQARGASLDGKSDVYSLALVLVEAVTGDVPFATDTTLGTLMARVDQPGSGARRRSVRCAVALEAPVAPTRPSRPDAAEFAALLMDAAKDLDRPEPLPLAGAMSSDTIVLDDRDPTTQYISERALVGETEPDIMRAPPGTTTDGITILEEGEGQPEIRTIDRRGPDVGEPSGPSRREQRAAKKARKADKRAVDRMARGGKRRRWPWVLVAVLLVAGAATGGFAYWYENVRVVTHTVPSFVGQNEAAVAPLLEEGGWTAEVTQTRVDGTEPGQILDQNPAANTQLEEGGVVALVVSLGPTLVALPPELVNKPVEEATAALTAAGFVVGEQIPQYSEEVAQGVVLEVGPDLLPEMPKGSTIPLVVSAGPAPRTIPDLGGLTVDQAPQRLEALQLSVTTQNRESDAPPGSLLGSDPASGQQAARGSTVTLLVAVPRTVTVPDVSGRTAADAATVLQGAGLQVSGTQGSPANPVRGTSPGVGCRRATGHRGRDHHGLTVRSSATVRSPRRCDRDCVATRSRAGCHQG